MLLKRPPSLKARINAKKSLRRRPPRLKLLRLPKRVESRSSRLLKMVKRRRTRRKKTRAKLLTSETEVPTRNFILGTRPLQK